MSHPPLLHLSHLHIQRNKNFSLVIDHLEIRSGEVIGLVGSNGSGKTTLLESLVGLVKPGSGIVQVAGQSPHSHLIPSSTLGYIPDDDTWLLPELTATEYFQLLISLAPEQLRNQLLRHAASLSSLLSLSQEQILMGKLSHGNRKKVQIIAALLYTPQLVIIDELRNGLDPLSLLAIEHLLEEYANTGTTIIAATHDLHWAERFTKHIGILKEGRLSLYAPISQIRKQYGNLEKAFLAFHNA